MFIQVEQGTKHPEAGPFHKYTQMFTVVIGYSRNYQIRVIKLIRGLKVLKIYFTSLVEDDNNYIQQKQNNFLTCTLK